MLDFIRTHRAARLALAILGVILVVAILSVVAPALLDAILELHGIQL